MVHKDTDIMVRLALTVHLTNTNEPLKWGCTYTQDVSDLKFVVDYNDARFFSASHFEASIQNDSMSCLHW